jgi:hypothetical protein
MVFFRLLFAPLNLALFVLSHFIAEKTATNPWDSLFLRQDSYGSLTYELISFSKVASKI